MRQNSKYQAWHNQPQNGRGRNRFLGGVTALASLGLGIASYALFHDPMRERMDRLTLRIPNAAGRLPRRGLRILHLTDTHFRGADWRERPKIEHIRRITDGMEVDVLIHTGDFLQDDRGLPNTLTLLDLLPKPRIASFAVLGNHDYSVYGHGEMLSRGWANFNHSQNGYGANGNNYGPIHQLRRFIQFGRYFANAPLDLKRTGTNDTGALKRELIARNVRILQNQHVRLLHRNGDGEDIDVYMAGIDDLTEGKPDLLTALQGIPVSAPTVLLSHNPDIVGTAGIERADVVLAGHTHGGQIVLPLLGPAHTHSEQLSRREASGYLRRGSTQVYISRGVGEGIPLRFAAAPQIALVTLLPG